MCGEIGRGWSGGTKNDTSYRTVGGHTGTLTRMGCHGDSHGRVWRNTIKSLHSISTLIVTLEKAFAFVKVGTNHRTCIEAHHWKESYQLVLKLDNLNTNLQALKTAESRQLLGSL